MDGQSEDRCIDRHWYLVIDPDVFIVGLGKDLAEALVENVADHGLGDLSVHHLLHPFYRDRERRRDSASVIHE